MNLHNYIKRNKNIEEPPGDLHPFMKTDEDIVLIVNTIDDLWYEKHTKDTDDFASRLTRQSRQLLWLVIAFLKHHCNPSDQSVDAAFKLLNTCVPMSKRHDENAFDVIVKDLKDQDIIKERYKYFKRNTFGIHSNCYKETVQMCVNALQEALPTLLFEALEKAKSEQSKESQDTGSEKNCPLFGKLANFSGQDYQVEQYTKHFVAVHEAGHAVAAYLLGLKFWGISIIPVNGSLGMIETHNWDEDAQKNAICTYAGPISEAVFFDTLFHEAWCYGSDVREATKAVKKEVIQDLSNPQEAWKYVFIDADELGLADKESPYIISETIKRCVALRQQAIDLITAHKEMVAALAQELLEQQYLPSEEVITLLEAWQKDHSETTPPCTTTQ